MQILKKINKNENIVLALGYFDGVHLGHQKIISELVKCAKSNNTKSALLTFQTNPSNFFKDKQSPDIQTIQDREENLKALGVDFIYELNFEEFKNIEAIDYLELLIKNFKPIAIVVGYNHTFGKNRFGNAEFLKQNSTKYNYKSIIVPEQKKNEERISSTSIRNKISLGDLEGAQALLGRNFSISNVVIKGDRIARKMGYPTANINWDDKIIKLPYGVYFGHTKVDNKSYPSMISWGCKPTLTLGQKEILETHIFQFNQDIYGKKIEVSFSKKLREQKTFKDITELTKQLHNDYQDFITWINL